MPSTLTLPSRLHSCKETATITRYGTTKASSYHQQSILSRNKRFSLNESQYINVDNQTEDESAIKLRRSSFHHMANACGDSADFTAYYAVSRRKQSITFRDDDTGLSGFLEYRKIDGSWRPFLFQTIGFQLEVYRVHMTHQVTVLSTDIRDATEIELIEDEHNKHGETRLLQLGVNNTLITLRAISHHAAMYWVKGLQTLQSGTLLCIDSERSTFESEDEVFRQIDQLALVHEWLPSRSQFSWRCFPFCGLL